MQGAKNPPAATPPSLPGDSPRAIDARLLLAELAQRWRGAQALEYRSESVLNHAGEFRIAVQVHALLRRPRLARVTFQADRAEFSQIRVCDGRRLFSRGASTPLRRAVTIASAYTGRLTENIPHPLDEASYTLDQFFSRAPFTPVASWGMSREPIRIEAMHDKRAHPVTGNTVPVLCVRFARGVFEDTLFLEPFSLALLELIRVGDHAGQVQKLLHETFHLFRLGGNFPSSLFTWTDADEKGETLR
jgi:hypothetical protein